jgi:hypothetical protein
MEDAKSELIGMKEMLAPRIRGTISEFMGITES